MKQSVDQKKNIKLTFAETLYFKMSAFRTGAGAPATGGGKLGKN